MRRTKSGRAAGPALTDELRAALRGGDKSAVLDADSGNPHDLRTLDDHGVQRALALVLMRDALAVLELIDERPSACHLQLAIDTLLDRRPLEPPSCIQ
ncbi:hypothetical protein [Rhizorhapis sp. SPR117]|uniref:hypothetical protein n=1 Tax=Rhizorhapis sp. SPR117 TaxID=2912611 RepID=UPI001F3A7B6D|nr:hypothetical protein [Rhizorhapis sp. SPR117]